MMFSEYLISEGEEFAKANYGSVLLVADYDTDGLAATALMRQALDRAGISHLTQIVQELDDVTIASLAEHEGEAIVFLDTGAVQGEELATLQRPVYVLDHHDPKGEVRHLNPKAHGHNERNLISAAGIAYFFALGMDKANKQLAPLGLLGALGDTQERDGLSEHNKMILQHAIIQASIKPIERLRLFGRTTRPLVKALTYSQDLGIPGVTGRFGGTKRFLEDLGIAWQHDGKPRTLADLTDEEEADLTDAILERKPQASDDELYVTSYEWTLMPDTDLKEVATMINACGRLGEYDIALDALCGDERARDELYGIVRRYKQVLHTTFEHIRNDKPVVSEGDNYILFHLDVPPSMAGIIASMLARNKHYPEGTIIGVLTAFSRDREKLSLRVSRDVKDIELNTILASTFPEISTGGHPNAAGAIFPESMHDDIVQRLEAAFEALK